MSTHLLPRPKSYEDAESSFLQKVVGNPVLQARYLAVSVIGLTAVLAMMCFLLIRMGAHQYERTVISIDNLGRPSFVGVTSSDYRLNESTLKYFLRQFAHSYYGRNHQTVIQDFATSFHFINAPLATVVRETERSTQEISKFVNGSDDDVDIHVDNIVLSDIVHQPYKAQIDFTKTYRARATGQETRRETYIASITFTQLSEPEARKDNIDITVNPLGLVITSVREDKAF
jgi:type IV secretory pathway TrbF-like protein